MINNDTDNNTNEAEGSRGFMRRYQNLIHYVLFVWESYMTEQLKRFANRRKVRLMSKRD